MKALPRCFHAAAIAVPAFLMFLIGLTPGISFFEDLGRHILLGRFIIENGVVPKTNLLTYTCPDFPVVNHHWLFQCAVAVLHPLIGMDGLILLKAVMMATSLAFALWTASSFLSIKNSVRGGDTFLPVSAI